MLSRREVFAALTGMLPGGGLLAGDVSDPEDRDLVKLLADAVQHLRLTSPPIGSVQAFAGDWPPRKAGGAAWTELEIGWLLCDGRKLADAQAALHGELEKLGKKIPEDGVLAELQAVLPQLPGEKPAETLPDYRGYFLRGVDRGAGGQAAGRDRDGIRAVGSPQGDSTKLPVNGFTTNEEPDHTHNAPTWHGNRGDKEVPTDKPFKWDYDYDPPVPTSPAGRHRHKVEGGDPETRPINVAVNYIIKFQ